MALARSVFAVTQADIAFEVLSEPGRAARKSRWVQDQQRHRPAPARRCRPGPWLHWSVLCPASQSMQDSRLRSCKGRQMLTALQLARAIAALRAACSDSVPELFPQADAYVPVVVSQQCLNDNVTPLNVRLRGSAAPARKRAVSTHSSKPCALHQVSATPALQSCRGAAPSSACWRAVAAAWSRAQPDWAWRSSHQVYVYVSAPCES